MNDSILPTPDFSSFPVSDQRKRGLLDILFQVVCWIATLGSLVVLAVLLYSIFAKARPLLDSRPDIVESNVWASFVQGSGETNDAELIDSGDLLQGIFVADRMLVGGLRESDDIDFGGSKSRIGLFSFELEAVDGSPDRFECKPATGKQNVLQLLRTAGFDMSELNLKSEELTASMVVLENCARGFDFDKLDGGAKQPLESANLIAAEDGWEPEFVIAFSKTADFCSLQFSGAFVEYQETDTVAEPKIRIPVAAVGRLQSLNRMGTMTALQSVISHRDPEVIFGPLKNRRPNTEEILVSDIAIRDKDAVFGGVSEDDRRGFQFGGSFDYRENFRPDQGTAGDQIAAFVTGLPKTEPAEAAIGPALAGTLWVCLGCALFALPLGIATAICLEEFKPKNHVLARLHSLVQLNISNLAGVPSIVYGIVGITAFATMFSLFGSPKEPTLEFGARHYYQFMSEGGTFPKLPAVRGSVNGKSKWVAPELIDGTPVRIDGEVVELNVIEPGEKLPDDRQLLRRTLYRDAEGGPVSYKPWYYLQLPFGRSVLAASLTLMLVILPVIIIATQEALRSVPQTQRQGALGLGSTRWQTVKNVTLPSATPNIMTGAILAMSRAIGEAAPIIVLAGTVRISSGPQHLMDNYSVLPVQLFYWATQPLDQLAVVNWQNVVSGGILVLLIILFTFNAIAITIRQCTQKPLS